MLQFSKRDVRHLKRLITVRYGGQSNLLQQMKSKPLAEKPPSQSRLNNLVGERANPEASPATLVYLRDWMKQNGFNEGATECQRLLNLSPDRIEFLFHSGMAALTTATFAAIMAGAVAAKWGHASSWVPGDDTPVLQLDQTLAFFICGFLALAILPWTAMTRVVWSLGLAIAWAYGLYLGEYIGLNLRTWILGVTGEEFGTRANGWAASTHTFAFCIFAFLAPLSGYYAGRFATGTLSKTERSSLGRNWSRFSINRC